MQYGGSFFCLFRTCSRESLVCSRVPFRVVLSPHQECWPFFFLPSKLRNDLIEVYLLMFLNINHNLASDIEFERGVLGIFMLLKLRFDVEKVYMRNVDRPIQGYKTRITIPWSMLSACNFFAFPYMYHIRSTIVKYGSTNELLRFSVETDILFIIFLFILLSFDFFSCTRAYARTGSYAPSGSCACG